MRVLVGLMAVAFLFVVSTFFGSWYTIDEGERGVITRNGAITGVATPGLGFKLPFVDGVEKISVRTEMVTIDELAAYSKDQQAASMKVTVNFRVLPDQVKSVYSSFGDVEALARRIILPRVNEELKTVFGQYTAASAIQMRDQLNIDVRAKIAEAVAGPVEIEGVQIENIDFSDAYEQAIEARMQAEVEVQKIRQQAEQAKVTAEITVTNAKATADSQRAQADAQAYATEVEAKAQAQATRLRGDAEADAIKARGDALKENPGLVALTQAERWDGKLPTTMVPGNAVPMLGVK